ncbi:aminotransferase class I/II-fold pyridoxal phosphate-dependent enzyme (plasmid) [Streptomyces sp. NBC_00841]|uniref:MocR-like pyridoxine biosynthesis transcription factor PdxR n=1 Tax=Streptomyces sp. NBC_00841 TaxID=2975847 RepID=UPI002DD9ADEB|nr:aminotransferase class I/II-fold pyridoxal phosphate-dependent enzyme [Streptomyces sp. NBC_00841]WSA04928.1 aminotransferase class I/II-fold pyridoxal phosphate-dependent enzyme [Streptomyces sp. NBC_00841]
MTARLVGKTALVTGSGHGIGAAIATGLAQAGVDVILLARTADQLDETANAIKASASSVEVRIVTTDLTNDNQRTTAIDDLLSGSPVDVPINNAATAEPLGARTRISPAQLRQAFENDLIRAGRGVRRALAKAVREAVRTGHLAPGTRLPSSRQLAADLGLARNTVADAYADLVAEGWLTARRGSGTLVADRMTTRPILARSAAEPSGDPCHDLIPGNPDLTAFPRAAWLKATRRALAAAPDDALGYGDPRGRPELRAALADHLARARSVYVSPEHILICAGVPHGLQILSGVLAGRGARNVAVESYGLDRYWGLLAAAGLKTLPLPLDIHGTDPVPPVGTDAVLLTPAHQFPVGTALQRDRRTAVVDWARRTGGLVLEDDYDGEFRFDRQSVGALQGLDPDCVVYLGTASQTLAPGLRLAWMALPPTLAEEAVAVKGQIDSCEVFSQLTMAEFITSGAYDRHVRAARRRYRDRRDALVTALAQHAPKVRVIGTPAGLHTVLGLPPGTEQRVLQSATRQGLKVAGLSQYRHERSLNAMADALVVGYGVPSDAAWPQALSALVRILS